MPVPVLALLALAVGAQQEAETQQPVAPPAASQRARAIEWITRPEFLERTVFAAAVDLPPAVLRSHLAELLRGPENPNAIRVAVHVVPTELAEAYEAGIWKPSLGATRVLLSELEAEGLERGSVKLLEAIFTAVEELRPLAGRLLWRAGADLSWTWFSETLLAADPLERQRLIEACGVRGDKACIPPLGAFLDEHADLGLGPAGLVALARLGHEPSKKSLDELVHAAADARRAAVLEALTPAAHARELQSFVQEALRRDDLTPAERLALQVGQVRAGTMGPRAAVRAAFLAEPGSATGLALARALAGAPEPADMEAFFAHIPVEGGPEAFEENVLLARTLLHLRHPGMNGLLHAALWSSDWNVSVLAGGLIARASGEQTLLDELEAAPAGTGEPDRRRVGFALGEWGGLGVVEELSRTRLEGDPVLQGALLGALAGRAEEDAGLPTERPPRPKVAPSFPDFPSGPQAHPKGKGHGGGKRRRPGR